MLDRIQHLSETLRTNWGDDPASRGAAKMAAGAVLFAEGMFGAVSRTAGALTPSQRSNRRGVVGGLLGVVFGAVFVIVGWFAGGAMTGGIEDGVRTTGTVVDVVTGRSDEGGAMYSPVVDYTVDDSTYTVQASWSSSSRPSIGGDATVVYSADEPDRAYVHDRWIRLFPWIFIGTGAFVAIGSLVHLLISVALVGFGVWLFRQGRGERGSAEADRTRDGFFTDLLDLFRGDERVRALAAGAQLPWEDSPPTPRDAPPDAQGDRAAGTAATSEAGPPPPPPSTGPPSGWYADPDSGEGLRWWDGQRWTEHRTQSGADRS
jgi:hypothetical protein